jgi:outer membrane protein
MKNFFVLMVGLVAMFAAVKTNAQMKAGHISLEDVVSIMPEARKADSLMQKFQQDSLQSRLPYFLSEYKRKDSLMKDPKTPAAIKETIGTEVEQLGSILQNWDQYSQQEMNRKQQELLMPLLNKAYGVLNDVAKENGYTYVFKQDALLVAPPTDDMLPLVAKKLGIKLPEQPKTGAPGPAPVKKN